MITRLRAAERRLGERLGRLFTEHDVLMTPVMAEPAVPAAGLMEGRGATVTYLWETGWVPFNVLLELDRAARGVRGSVIERWPSRRRATGSREPTREATLFSLAAELGRRTTLGTPPTARLGPDQTLPRRSGGRSADVMPRVRRIWELRLRWSTSRDGKSHPLRRPEARRARSCRRRSPCVDRSRSRPGWRSLRFASLCLAERSRLRPQDLVRPTLRRHCRGSTNRPSSSHPPCSGPRAAPRTRP